MTNNVILSIIHLLINMQQEGDNEQKPRFY